MTLSIKPDSLSGAVLAAAPAMLDPNFNQSLVYLAEHNAKGALGVIMNRPLGRTLGEIASSPALPAGLLELPVFLGGPVQRSGLVLAVFHRGKTDEDLQCELHSDPLTLSELPAEKNCWVRAFLGYAGWGKGQLENELQQNAWNICVPHTVLLDEKCAPDLWRVFVGEDQRWRRLLPFLPKNPGLN